MVNMRARLHEFAHLHAMSLLICHQITDSPACCFMMNVICTGTLWAVLMTFMGIGTLWQWNHSDTLYDKYVIHRRPLGILIYSNVRLSACTCYMLLKYSTVQKLSIQQNWFWSLLNAKDLVTECQGNIGIALLSDYQICIGSTFPRWGSAEISHCSGKILNGADWPAWQALELRPVIGM